MMDVPFLKFGLIEARENTETENINFELHTKSPPPQQYIVILAGHQQYTHFCIDKYTDEVHRKATLQIRHTKTGLLLSVTTEEHHLNKNECLTRTC